MLARNCIPLFSRYSKDRIIEVLQESMWTLPPYHQHVRSIWCSGNTMVFPSEMFYPVMLELGFNLNRLLWYNHYTDVALKLGLVKDINDAILLNPLTDNGLPRDTNRRLVSCLNSLGVNSNLKPICIMGLVKPNAVIATMETKMLGQHVILPTRLAINLFYEMAIGMSNADYSLPEVVKNCCDHYNRDDAQGLMEYYFNNWGSDGPIISNAVMALYYSLHGYFRQHGWSRVDFVMLHGYDLVVTV